MKEFAKALDDFAALPATPVSCPIVSGVSRVIGGDLSYNPSMQSHLLPSSGVSKKRVMHLHGGRLMCLIQIQIK